MELTANQIASRITGQKFCEEHHKYYGPRNKYKTCPDCGYGSYKDFEESQEDFDINNPEELAR